MPELMRKDKQVELIKKPVQLSEMTKQETIQAVKERDIIVPDGKPDVNRVMHLDGIVNMEQIDVQDDRVIYKGQIEVTILYLPQNGSEEMYSMKSSIPLEDFVIVDGLDSTQQVEMDYHIEHIQCNIINERKINVKTILQVTVGATKQKEAVIVTGTEGLESAQTQTKLMDIVQLGVQGNDNMIVKDELTIMQGKDSIDEILKMNASIKEEQVKRTDTDILYNGIVEIDTLYKGQSEDRPLQVVKHRIPFKGSIEVLREDTEMYWNCDMDVKITYTRTQPDYDGEDRIIELECVVVAKYSTYNKMTEEVIDDIYCPGKKMDMNKQDENFMTLIGRVTSRMPKKEIISMHMDAPNPEQIFGVKLTPVIDEKEIQNDKVIIKGMMETKVMYMAEDKMEPVQMVMDLLPFVQEVMIPGVAEDQLIQTNIKAKDINVSPYNKTDMMVEYVLDCIVDAYKKEGMSSICDIVTEDMDKDQMNQYPSITVYVIKKGDSLWSIAKKFNTTVKEIEEVNELEPNCQIHPMQKLIVLKKTKF